MTGTSRSFWCPELPVCPKCHKMISERRWQRHLERCGVHHKRETAGLYVPSATPPWEGTQTGILVNAGGGRQRGRHRRGHLRWAFAAILLALVLATLYFLA